MLRMLLYPTTSDLAFLPAAYQPPAVAAALSMTNCTIVTLCRTVTMYTEYFKPMALREGTVSSGMLA